MTQRKKEQTGRKLKSSTSFVHHPQAASHKAVSRVTARAVIIQRRRSCDIESGSGFHRQQHIGRDDYKARPLHDRISTYPEQNQGPGSRGWGPSPPSPPARCSLKAKLALTELNMCRVSPSRGCGGCFGPGRCGRAAWLALRDRV